MGDSEEIICPYCSTLFRHRTGLSPHAASPPTVRWRNLLSIDPRRDRARFAYRRDSWCGNRRAHGQPIVSRRGFRVVVFETAERLDPIGAGIQLSPNASRILIDLGLEDQLKPQVVCPEELIVKIARTGHILARTPLGKAVEQTYGAPYWVIHRADLQTALADAASASPNIELRLGSKIDTFTAHDRGVMLEVSRGMSVTLDDGDMLICADGLWSSLRRQCGHRNLPKFAHHTAWRALIPADAAPAEMRAPAVNLWIGHNAHLVHYPVKGGNMINIVAILRDAWNEPGWSSSGCAEMCSTDFQLTHGMPTSVIC